MSFTITLRQEDARLVYLAIVYHLARPGSELDPQTKTQAEHGLAEVTRRLQPQLRSASATIDLDSFLLERLGNAILGTINELKVYPMLQARPAEQGGGRASTVLGFDETLRRLFPQVEEDAEEAIALAEPLLTLKRRLDAAAQEAGAASVEAERTKRAPRWQFWRRS